MKIETVRFGELEVEESSIIHFPEGIVPFGRGLDFALVGGEDAGGEAAGCAWLQCVGQTNLAFWVAHAARVFPDRTIGIDERQIALLGADAPEQLHVLLILSVQDGEVTANLLAPVLINPAEQLGQQIVLAGSLELVRLPVPLERLVRQPA